MPLRTPSSMITSSEPHTSTCGQNTPGTKSNPAPASGARLRNSPKKKPLASSPQLFVTEKIMNISAQATITA